MQSILQPHLKALTYLAVLVCPIVSCPSTFAKSRLAFAKSGVFVLSQKPNRVVRGRKVFSRIAFLPAGSLLHVHHCIKIVEHRRRQATYCRVDSLLGTSGLVRRDLFEYLGRRTVAVAIGSKTIPITGNDPENIGKQISTFSRSKGVFVEIIDIGLRGYYVVRLPWTGKPNFPETWTIGRLSKDWELNEDIKVINSNFRTPSNSKPYRFVPAGQAQKVGIDLRTVNTKSYWAKATRSALDKAISVLKKLDKLQCISKVSATVKSGFELLGNGLGVKIVIDLLQPGHMYRVNFVYVAKGDEVKFSLVVIKDIECTLFIPTKLNALILISDESPPENSAVVYENADSTNANSIRIIGGSHRDPPMYPLRSLDDYDKIYRMLLDQVPQSRFLDKQPVEERDVLLHFIINQISFVSP